MSIGQIDNRFYRNYKLANKSIQSVCALSICRLFRDQFRDISNKSVISQKNDPQTIIKLPPRTK